MEARTSGEGGGGTSGRGGISAPRRGSSTSRPGVSAPRAGLSRHPYQCQAGANNPNYTFHHDSYGHLYAMYVGPYDGYVYWSIWVPKTICANMRGSTEKQWI